MYSRQTEVTKGYIHLRRPLPGSCGCAVTKVTTVATIGQTHPHFCEARVEHQDVLIQEMNRYHRTFFEIFNVLITHQLHVLRRLKVSQNLLQLLDGFIRRW